MDMIKKLLITVGLTAITATQGFSQMERERVITDGPVDEIFWAPTLVGMSTVQNLPKQNLNVTIMHNFGLLNEQWLQNFFGMDFGATVRLGADYGITDQWTVGAGRISPQKVYDFRTQYAVFKQSHSGSVPVSLSLKAALGINTRENGFAFGERLDYFGSVMVARRFSDKLSVQAVPMLSYFSRVFAGQENLHMALGLGAEYRLNDRWALMGEYYPVFGDRSDGTLNAFAAGVNIETGGHVFQLFLKSSNWHTEPYIISQNSEDFWGGDIRFGFNVNRIFRIGGE